MKRVSVALALLALAASAPAQVLWDNGPLGTGTVSGGGAVAPAGTWWSQVQPPGTIAGYGHQLPIPIRVADDFTIPAGQTWDITNIGFFAYQSGSGLVSTLTSYDVKIWGGGAPGVAPLLWSGLVPVAPAPAWPAAWLPVTGAPPPWPVQPPWPWPPVAVTPNNTSSFTQLYRIFAPPTAPGTTRPIMFSNIPTAGMPQLGAGTYWLDWAATGTLTSGPWAPQVTIGGLTGKPGANGMQWQAATGWLPVTDPSPGAPQDFPFIIIPEPTTTLGLLVLGVLALRRR